MRKLEFNWFHSAKGGVKLQVLDINSEACGVLAILDTRDFKELKVMNLDVQTPSDVIKYCDKYKGTSLVKEQPIDSSYTIEDNLVVPREFFLREESTQSNFDEIADLYDQYLAKFGEPTRFYDITSKYYIPKDDGESEGILFLNLANLSNVNGLISNLKTGLI